MTDSVAKLARRLYSLEREVRSLGSTPQLAYSSIDDGAMTVVMDGVDSMVIGQQYDGTTTAAVVSGPPPPTPSQASVTDVTPGGLTIRWDGTYTDALVAPMDFSRVTVHVFPQADWDGIIDSQERDLPKATFTSATGGEVFVPTEAGIEYLVVLLAWSQAGKVSAQSFPTVGIATTLGLNTDSPEWQALMAQAADAETAAADAQTASAQAAADALAANQAADAAGDTAAAAQTAADAAQQAALAAQAAADAAASPEEVAAAQQAAADATAAALAAQQAADDAQAAAEAAGASATAALESANGKAKVTFATFPPGDAANNVGDIWWHRHATTGHIVGQYAGLGGTSWQPQQMADAVIANLDAGKVTFGTMSGERIEVGTLVIGQVGGLTDELASKETPAGATTKANSAASAAQAAAISAAAADATTKANDAKTAAEAAAALTAQAKADTAKAEALTAAADTAQQKADAAAATAQAAAISSAATTAQQKADAAQAAAISSAAATAQIKADAAQAAALNAAMAAGFLNTNPTWSTWTAALPTGVTAWGGTAPTKDTTVVRTSPNAMRFNVTDAAMDTGVNIAGVLSGIPISDYMVVEVEVFLTSGNFNGSGILLDWAGLTPNRDMLRFDAVGATPQTGKWYRFTKTLKRPSGSTGTQTGWGGYLMANYVSLGTKTIKNIAVDRIGFRPATAEEITAYNSPANIALAQSTAISTAASDASTAYGGTKSLVAGWVVSGKTTINGGQIETDSILAAQIKAGEIEVKHLAVGAVTAASVDAQSVGTALLQAGVIQSQLVMTGTIQVGSSYWNTTEGLVIPQADGGVIKFPVDGSAATIYAHLIARSLNVQDDFTINGYGEVKGEMSLANGITKPTSAPGIAATWPSTVATALGDGVADNGDIYSGATNHHSNADWMATAVVYFGGGVRLLNKRTGDIAVYPDPTNGKSWCTDFYPWGGIVYAGGSYYVMGTDNARNIDIYIYRLDTSFNKVSETKVGAYNAFGDYQPRLGPADATSTQPALFWTPADGSMRMRTYVVGLTSSTDRTLIAAGGTRYNFGGIVWETPTSRMRIFTKSGSSFTFSNTFARVTGSDMPRAGGANVKGAVFDASTSKVISYDNAGRLYYYSLFTAPTTVGAAYTWYDGDGTIRETEPSPEGTITIQPGQWPSVTLPPAPDEKITDATRTDKANRIGVYVRAGGNPLRLQKYTSVPVVNGSTVTAERSWSTDVITTSGQTAPTVNGFAGAAVQPGRITSKAMRADGRPKTEISGNGEARVDGLIIPGMLIPTSGHATDRVGWLVANGRSLAASDYPDLAAEYNLGNGNYRWGGTVASGAFNLPSSAGRFPVAAGGTKAHGGYGGSDTVTMPDHIHFAGTLDTTNTDLNRLTNTTTGGTAARLAPAGTNHNHAITGKTGVVEANPAISNVPLYFGVTYLVKT